jgi:peptidoglycan hydrolase CwlO-like protein
MTRRDRFKMLKKKVVSLILVYFVISSILTPNAFGVEVVETLTCGDVNPDTRESLGAASVFFTHVNDVFVWVRMSGIQPGQSLRFIWSSPGGVIFADNEETLTTANMDYWDSIHIKGNWPEQDPGIWNVDLYVDDALESSISFEIIDYDAIILREQARLIIIASLNNSIATLTQSYTSIQEDLITLNSEIDSLSEDYLELNEDYSSLQEMYNEANSDLQTLMTEYSTIHDDYESLSAEYGSNSEELSSTQKALNTTRTLLYASSGLALVLLIVSAYLIYTGRKS